MSKEISSAIDRYTPCENLLELYKIPQEWFPSSEALEFVDLLVCDVDRRDGEAIHHALNSLKNLSLFCKTLSRERRLDMADAMLLHDIPGRILHRESEERAELSDDLQEGWKEYIQQLKINNRSQAIVDYMHDQVVIGMSARAYRESIKFQSNGISLHDKEMINNASYDGMVNVAGWGIDMPRVRGDELAVLSGEVNIESLIIKAAEMLDNIKNPPEQDSQQLRNILEAESFILVALEVLGYDAMAAEMASSCNIYRLRGQGRGDLVERAADMYREYSKKDPAELAVQVFGLSEKPDIHWIVNETSEDICSGINCRFAELIIPIAGVPRRVLFRQKSIGSMAKKMSKKGENYTIMDALAFQVVCDAGDDTLDKKHHYEMTDEEIDRIHTVQTDDLANVFSSFVSTIFADERLRVQSGDGASSPVYVQGNDSYIDAVYSKLALEHKEFVGRELKEQETPYRVCRATAFVDDFPVEVQLITDLDRKLGRTDATSHVAYKNGNGNNSLRWMHQLHRRLEYMKSGDGNPISRAIGRQALLAVMRGVYPDSFSPEDLYNKNVR